jgi:hypothetical protein
MNLFKHAFITIFGLVLFATNLSANAADLALAIGQASDSSIAANATSNDVTGGSILGGIATGDISGALKFRGGMLYRSRAYGNSVAGTKNTYSFNYAEIPLGILWQFTDYGGAFAGLNIGMNVSANCSPTACASLSGSAIGTQIGFQGKFHPNFGGSMFFESTPALVSTLDRETAFGILLHIYFY